MYSSATSLLVHKNAEFCMLILYPVTLLKSFISFNRFIFFLFVHLDLSTDYNMSRINRNNPTSSFPIWMTFIFFSYLTYLAKTFITMFSESGERGNPCLVAVLRGNTFSFSPLSMILALVLSHVVFIV